MIMKMTNSMATMRKICLVGMMFASAHASGFRRGDFVHTKDYSYSYGTDCQDPNHIRVGSWGVVTSNRHGDDLVEVDFGKGKVDVRPEELSKDDRFSFNKDEYMVCPPSSWVASYPEQKNRAWPLKHKRGYIRKYNPRTPLIAEVEAVKMVGPNKCRMKVLLRNPEKGVFMKLMTSIDVELFKPVKKINLLGLRSRLESESEEAGRKSIPAKFKKQLAASKLKEKMRRCSFTETSESEPRDSDVDGMQLRNSDVDEKGV